MKIKSEYLGKEFDVEVNETVMDGRKVQLIPHSVLTWQQVEKLMV